MKRYRWADIKAQLKLQTRVRIESEARRLSEELDLARLRRARDRVREATKRDDAQVDE